MKTLTEDMIRVTNSSIGKNGRMVRDRPHQAFVGHVMLKDARGRPRRFSSRSKATKAAKLFIANYNQETIHAHLRTFTPMCIASMGCLCAGHARGNPSTDACDTREP